MITILVEYKRCPIYEGINEISFLFKTIYLNEFKNYLRNYIISERRSCTDFTCYVLRLGKLDNPVKTFLDIVREMKLGGVKIICEDKLTKQILCSIKEERVFQEVEDTSLNTLIQ